MIPEPPVRLCCGERHWGVVCLDGLTLCPICFERYAEHELYVDDAGQVWDVCVYCKSAEEKWYE